MDLLREKLRSVGHHRAQVAAAMIGSAVVGGVMSSEASKSAANTQANAANQATQAQKDMFNTTVGLEAPYRTAGVDATNRLSYLLGTNPNGYSASQMAAPGVAAPATTQYATGVPSAGGAAPVAAGPYAGMSADQIRAQLLPQFTKLADMGLSEFGAGGSMLPPSMMPSTVDEAGLNAAVQKALAQRQAAPAMATPQQTGMAMANPAVTATQGTGPAGSGTGGYGSLLHNFDLSDFQMDPGIQFQTQQGNLALQNSQAAKDGVMSGSALKDLIAYNQGMAGTGYQSAYDRYMANKQFTLGSLMGVSQLGQAAAGNTVNNAGGFSSGIASTIQGAGNAQAAGTVGSANALSGAASGASNAYLLSNMLKTSGSSGGNTMTVDPTMSYIYGTGGIGD